MAITRLNTMDRGQQRQHDIAKPLPRPSPVDGGGIQECLGDFLQAGEKYEGAGPKPPQT